MFFEIFRQLFLQLIPPLLDVYVYRITWKKMRIMMNDY